MPPLQVSPVRGVFLQVQPSEADDIHMSDASDAEFVQLPGEVPQEGGSASAHLNGGRGDAGWPGSPTSPALAPSFFDVDLRDPGALPGHTMDTIFPGCLSSRVHGGRSFVIY